MNVEILNSFLVKLRELEKQFSLQQKLNAVKSALDAVTSAPQDAIQQSNLAKALDELKKGFANLTDRLSPKEIDRLDDINAARFFDTDLVDGIRNQIAENSMSPAVVRDSVAKIIGERQQYLTATEAIMINFGEIGIDEIKLEADEAEIGFQIPRQIFENNLDGFIKELRTVRSIITTFSDAVLGHSQEIELTQLSTSDPLIFFGIDPDLIKQIGLAFSWAIATWFGVEKIRNLRAQTAELGGVKKIEKEFEDKIEASIKEAIENKAKELSDGKKDPELKTRLAFSLRQILERVERGMTVEIRMLPPAEPDDSDEDKPQAVDDSPMNDLYQLSQTLVFPEPSKTPILEISSLPENHKDKPKK